MKTRKKRACKPYGGRKYWREGKQITVNEVASLVPCSNSMARVRIYKFDTLDEILAPPMGKNIEFTLKDGRKVNTKDVVKANPKISMSLALIRLKNNDIWEDVIRDPEQCGGDPKGVLNGTPAKVKPVKTRAKAMVFGIDPLTVLSKPVKIDDMEDK